MATAAARLSRRLLSLCGYAVIGTVIWWRITEIGGLPPDLAIWDRVGDQALRGISPYQLQDLTWTGFFFYAPPWALAFGLFAWLPIQVQAALIFALELVSLRYVAGSWLRVGYFGLIPLTGFELSNGSFNLVIAAAIAAAMRGDGRLAAWMSLAKLSPVLATRDVRRVGLVIAVAVALTVPVWAWWGDWISLLLWSGGHAEVGLQIWLPGRVALALALVLFVRRPWAQGLAAVVALPALYSWSIVLLYPVIMEAAAEWPGMVERARVPRLACLPVRLR